MSFCRRPQLPLSTPVLDKVVSKPHAMILSVTSQSSTASLTV